MTVDNNEEDEIKTDISRNEETEKKSKLWKCLSPFIGIIATGASAAVFAFSNMIVQWLTDVDPFTISLFRFLGIFFLASPIVLYNYFKEGLSPFPKGKRWALFGRSFLGSICLLIHFYGLKHLPMADVNLITATAPAFTVFSARIFLKEPISKIDLLNVVVILIGVTLIVKPPFMFGETEIYAEDPDAIYAVVALLFGSVFLLSNAYTLIRFLRDLPLATVLINFGFVGSVVAGASSLAMGCACLPTDTYSWTLLLLIGLVSFLGQLGLAFGARFQSAAKISLLREAFELLFAFIFQIVFFKQIPDLLTIVGAVLVVAAIVIASSKTFLQNLPQDQNLWIKFKTKFFGITPETKSLNQDQEQNL